MRGRGFEKKRKEKTKKKKTEYERKGGETPNCVNIIVHDRGKKKEKSIVMRKEKGKLHTPQGSPCAER